MVIRTSAGAVAMMLSGFLLAGSAYGQPMGTSTDERINGFRSEIESLKPSVSKYPKIQTTDHAIPLDGREIAIRIYASDAERPRPTLVYVHGACWIAGSLDSHDEICRHLAAEGGAMVVAIDYRLAPEHPFPAAHDDVYEAVEWLWEHAAELGIDRSKLALGGESAGAHLAAATALRAIDDPGGPELDFLLLVYAALDGGGSSWAECKAHYFPNREDARSRYGSPLWAGDLSAMPPTYNVFGEYEPSRAEQELFLRKLRDHGVETDAFMNEGVGHDVRTWMTVRGDLAAHAAAVGMLRGALGGDSSPEDAAPPRSIVPLEGTEPTDAKDTPTGDLAHLAQWIGGATIVGLGEGSHGTHTLHRLAHRMFQYLAEEEGFEVFALEIDQAHAAILDEFVQGERDDLDHQMTQGWWAQQIFYDEALADLLRWMRQYNQTSDRPLHFAGYDAKQPRLAAERLTSAIREADPKALARVRDLLARALAPDAFGIYPNVWGFSSTVRFTFPPQDAEVAVEVAVEVRGEGVDYGLVGFSARSDAGKPSEVRFVPIEDLRATGSTYRVELQVPALASALDLSLFHRGNGTVSFGRPVVHLGDRRLETSGGFESSGELETIEPSPLMMPALQRMDYRAEVLEDAATGRPILQIAADPLLDRGLDAARATQRQIEELLGSAELEGLSPAQTDWVRQLSRLVTQAVEWRVLAEPNRDVFLAENLLWLQRTAFPRRRILALAHASHTERRPRRMGDFVARALGEDYRAVSMVAGSGSRRDFGNVSELHPGSPLEEIEIDPARLSSLETAAGGLHSGNFLVQLSGDPDAARTPDLALCAPSCPDALVFVREVAPLRGLH